MGAWGIPEEAANSPATVELSLQIESSLEPLVPMAMPDIGLERLLERLLPPMLPEPLCSRCSLLLTTSSPLGGVAVLLRLLDVVM
jgi:hypothetical protein